MKKENVYGSVSLKLDVFDLLRIKVALNRSIGQECYYYEITCLERLLLRVELLEKGLVENPSGTVILKLDVFDILRIKTALNRSISQERYYCENLKLSDYEVTCLECILLRLELLEKNFMDY